MAPSKKTPTKTAKSVTPKAPETLAEVKVQVANASNVSEKLAKEAAARNKEVLDSAVAVKVDTVATKAAGLGLDIQRALAEITEKVSAEAGTLQTLTEAVELKRAELERLHGVDVVATAIDELVRQHAEKEKALQTKILEAETKFLQDKEARERAEKEAATEREKARKREEDDFNYKTAQSRKLEEDKWKEKVRLDQAAERDRKEAVEKDLKARQEVLTSKETAVKALEDQVAAFPETLKKEVSKAEAIVTSSLKKEYDHKSALAEAAAKAAQSLSEQTIKGLQSDVARLNSLVATLQTELTKAQAQVTDIAKSALESASGQRALAELRDVTSRESVASNRNSK